MSVWEEVIGQEVAVRTLSQAVADPEQMTHAWLLTGPPGSGRSVAARAFAAALQCPHGGCGQCRECRTALDGSHADVDVVATEGLSIKVAEARQLVQTAALRPSVGAWRVIVIEDADRLTERAADALLKAGARNVSAYITHGVLSDTAPNRVAASKLKELVVSDSIEARPEVAAVGNIRRLPIAALIGEAIARTASEQSVSSLFD